MLHAMRRAIALLVLGLAAMPRAGFPTDPAHGQDATTPASAAKVAYPLKVSASRRYLVDQENRPFLMVGDSPQALIGRLSEADAALFMKNRARYGINTLWINLLCNDGTACNPDGTTFDGLAPFMVPGDLSTPNPLYFQRAARMIELAAANGMVVLLVPAETIGWLKVLRANGPVKAYQYGLFLGARFKGPPNIIWMSGNDFQSWRDPTDDAVTRALAVGIREADPAHLQTAELNYLSSGSLDSAGWASFVDLDAAYTYFPTYGQVLIEYNREGFRPVFMVEANYEFERDVDGLPANLRRQAYWTMLSGATGQLYASGFSWQLSAGWQRNLDTPGIRQFALMKSLFTARRWYDLVPDQEHRTLIAGYGSFSRQGRVSANDYVTAARTPDGALVMAYLPSARTVTLDMAKLQGKALARWYDPTDGSYRAIEGSPLANVGSRQFTPPAKNGAGDDDWVLVLEASADADIN